MTELLTAAQMRAIEQAAIDSGEVTGLELMERAGRGVVEAVFEEWPELAATSHRAVVLCGPGNNGGDGFVVARLLKGWGWEVEVFLYGDAEKLPPDARVNYERWGEMGEVRKLALNFEVSTREASLTVDALFGTGLARPIANLGLTLLDIQEQRAIGSYTDPEWRFGAASRVVSIDLPSGICSDSGKAIEERAFKGIQHGVAAERHVDADLTVSFHDMKLCHVLDQGANSCGKTVVKSIGLETVRDSRQVSLGEVVRLVNENCAGSLHKQLDGHKFSNGHALILSGPSGRGGAARLAARGALRIGSGVVTVGCPPEAVAENAAQLNAIMLEVVHDGDALARILQDERINALCLGPALGLGRARELVPVALASGRACVLDADALSAFADDPKTLFELTSSHRSVVLTPHAGEFARLFPVIAMRLREPPMSGPAYSKVDATRDAAKRAGCVVLFKGADTVIADEQGRAAINSAHYERAAPWLATAGSGDVLAGFITGLLARGFPPMQAAQTGAWLHVECARSFGAGLIAEDLPEELPKVFQALDIG